MEQIFNLLSFQYIKTKYVQYLSQHILLPIQTIKHGITDKAHNEEGRAHQNLLQQLFWTSCLHSFVHKQPACAIANSTTKCLEHAEYSISDRAILFKVVADNGETLAMRWREMTRISYECLETGVC